MLNPSIRRALAAIMSFFGATLATAAPPQFKLTIVPAPPKYDQAEALGVNGRGDTTVITYDTSSDRTGYFAYFFGEGYRSIPVPQGGAVTSLKGINNSREVIGTSTEGAFVWSPQDGWTSLRPPAGYVNATPTGINLHGEVVGYVVTEAELNFRQPFHWSKKNGMTVRPGPRSAWPAAINNRGASAGTIEVSKRWGFGTEAVYGAKQNDIVPISDVGGDSFGTVAMGLNDYGQVVASCLDGSGSSPQPCWWTKNAGTRLLYAGSNAEAYAISNSGDIVGIARDLTSLGFVWNVDYGLVPLLNTLSPDSPSVDVLYPHDISEKGVVAGSAVVSGVVSVAIMFPVK